MSSEVLIDNRTVKMWIKGNPKRLFLLLTESTLSREWDSLVAHLEENTVKSEEGFAIVTWPIEDWNGELSPWPAKAVFGKEDFSGNGEETLHRIESRVLPIIHKQFGEVPVFLCGYSLAGLFSLWAMTKSNHFAGAVSCSGSLWYDGWMNYWNGYENAKQRKTEGLCVYLSLGRREEKTRNAKMATVGDVTRAMAACLEESTIVKESVLEWNDGGHFADSGERLAKGICWIMEKQRVR